MQVDLRAQQARATSFLGLSLRDRACWPASLRLVILAALYTCAAAARADTTLSTSP